jgi:membrane protein implicated in regulation of membrane protease activity
MKIKTDRTGRSQRESATLSAGVGGMVALALCCGGAVLALAFGLAAVAALLINPWFLIPVVSAAVALTYWRATRKAAACNNPHDASSAE